MIMSPLFLLPLQSPWWRHQLETFSALLAICAGNSPVTGEFPAQGPVTRSFDVFFDLRLNERLGKQSWGWWFETPSRPLWRHSNAKDYFGSQGWWQHWVKIWVWEFMRWFATKCKGIGLQRFGTKFYPKVNPNCQFNTLDMLFKIMSKKCIQQTVLKCHSSICIVNFAIWIINQYVYYNTGVPKGIYFKVTWWLTGYLQYQINKRLSKQPRRRWFETPLRPLWRHCNVIVKSLLFVEI